MLAGLLELIAPTRCVGCELPGALLCDHCARVLPLIAAATSCPACGAPWGHLVCTECWEREFAFEAALALGELDGVLSRAVVVYKDAGERRLAGLLGSMLARRVVAEWAGWPDVVTWVPPTGRALARRGFDHARFLAAPVAESLGVPLEQLLTRTAARDQRTLSRTDRAANACGTFAATEQGSATVLVVDDVLTTGATLGAAADALLGAGARAVRIATIARAW